MLPLIISAAAQMLLTNFLLLTDYWAKRNEAGTQRPHPVLRYHPSPIPAEMTGGEINQNRGQTLLPLQMGWSGVKEKECWRLGRFCVWRERPEGVARDAPRTPARELLVKTSQAGCQRLFTLS